MLHVMKLSEAPFGRMQQGLKKLELRLYDEKRRQIRKGDLIEFRKLPDLQGSLVMKVADFVVCPRFKQVIDMFPTGMLGYAEDQRTYLRTSMYEIYSEEEETRYGAMGIVLEAVSDTEESATNEEEHFNLA